MASLDDYKNVLDVLIHDTEDLDLHSLVTDDLDVDLKVTLEDGVTYDLTRGWYDELHRFSNDGVPQLWYWQFSDSDKYAFVVRGYYDSWEGSTIESDIEIGEKTEIVKKYVNFILVS